MSEEHAADAEADGKPSGRQEERIFRQQLDSYGWVASGSTGAFLFGSI